MTPEGGEHCPCGGSGGEHFVYVAFLKDGSAECPHETWGVDYYVFPINRMTRWFTRSNMTHVQLAFWDAGTRGHITFSADKNQKCVHRYDSKDFSRSSWRFFKLKVTQWEEVTMYRFLESQVNKPFNFWGQIMCIFWPWSGRGQSWFCSELVMAAFQAALKYPGFYPEETSPGQVHAIITHDPKAKWAGHIVLLTEDNFSLTY